jgi:polyhydroxyalkanoate synthase subunit PhaC
LYRRARRGASPHVLAHPTLLVAGTGDRIMPAMRMRDVARRIVHPDVRWLEFGRAAGHVRDYGHTELLIGRHAEREVFPAIAEFLAAP